MASGFQIVEFEDVLNGERLYLCQPFLRTIASMEAESSRITATDSDERVAAAARHV
jgi:hypothetical protein